MTPGREFSRGTYPGLVRGGYLSAIKLLRRPRNLAARLFQSRLYFLGRGELFAGLFLLAFANGIEPRISRALSDGVIWAAILNTFEISAIVWMACWMAIALLLRPLEERASGTDLLVGLGVVATTLVPFAQLSWIGLTGLGVYILHGSATGSPQRRGAVILLALTVPMFWSRLLFAMLSGWILQADAMLASLIIGTDRVGNTIRFADNTGYLFIGPPCSSLANLSLAMLASVLFCQTLARRPSRRQVGWCLLAATAVIAINVCRIGLIGLHPGQFELLHGPVGAAVAGWLTLAAIVGINIVGFRDAIFADR